MSDDFVKSVGIACDTRNAHSASLADGTSVGITGCTPKLSVKLSSVLSKHKFLVLPNLDGMDVVLGMDYLATNDATVHPRKLTVSLPSAKGTIVVKAAPQQPMFPHMSTTHVDVVSGAKLARIIRHETKENCDFFIGYVKEAVSHTNDEAFEAARPTQYTVFEKELCTEYADVIRDEVPPGLPPVRKLDDGRVLEHSVPLKPDAKPVSQQPYRMSPDELVEVNNTLTKLTNQGWIRPSLSPWGSPVLFQRKKNGKLRMCVDYRALNHNTVKFAYPMPRIEQLLESLKDYTVVSKLDLAEGFHQIRMDPNDIPKTTFVTQFGAFEFLVMPFGLANAPAQFTLLMNTVLKGLPFVVVFMDDILVFSKTVSEHHDHVREVLNRLRTHKLYASPKKCEFYRESVEYLGHVITPEGVTVLPSKVNAVQGWPAPTDLKSLRQFLGLTGFYRHFVPQYGTVAAPLTDLLQSSTPWHWSSRQQSAFDSLKVALCAAPVLCFPDPEKPFVVGTDASDYAVGAVLQQDHGRGLQPVAYLSRKLSSAERNYAVHEKELLAIVHSVRTWRHHLQGARHTIKVLTDHVTLRYFHRQPKLSQRQMRWTELFQSFDLDIQYKPGRENTVPDALSRRPDLKTVLCAMFNSQPLPDQDFLHRVRSGYAADPVANHLFQSQQTPSATGANPAYRVINNLLFFVDRAAYRLYIPNSLDLKAALLQDAHAAPGSGHPGITRLQQSLQRHYYWPRMADDISAYVRSCRECQLIKPSTSPAAPQTTFPFPKQPFQEIALDFVGPLPPTARGHDFLLNVTDRLTKFAVSIPCSQKISKTQLAHALFEHIYCRFGIPQVIVSDRDTRIDNEFFRILSSLQGTTHRLTTAYRPRGNGQAEAFNKEIINKLRVPCADPSQSQTWDQALPHLVYAYNNTPHSAHKFTPFYLLFGFHPSSLEALYLPSQDPPFPTSANPAAVSEFRRFHADALQRAHTALQEDAERRQSRNIPHPSRLPAFKVGDLVSVSTQHLPRDVLDTKFAPRFLGPFKIVKVPRPYVYVVDFGAKFPNANALVNADLLRPFVQPSSTPLRHAEDDFPLVGDPNRPIERLVSRARARGRPPAHGRPSFQYRVRFSDLDSHYDVWLTEKELHTKHPDVAPSLIAACDEQYPV